MNLFGSQVKKGYVIAGGAVIAVAAVYGWRKNKQAASSSSASSVPSASSASDPYPPDGTSGNSSDPYSTDPATGQTYGNEGAFATGYGALGSSAPLDTYGYTGSYYGSTMAAETAYATNGQWAQAAEDYLSSTVGADTTTVAAALGKYVTGQALSSDQVSVIEQAIAFVGYPPVNGPDGYPPQIRTQPPPAGGTTPPPSTAPPPTSTSPPPATPPPSAPATPATPGGVRATAYTNYIDVGWAPVPGATGYTLHATYQEPASGGSGIYPGTVFGTSGRIGGLSPNRTYTLHVAATNAAGTSPETNGPAVKTK